MAAPNNPHRSVDHHAIRDLRNSRPDLTYQQIADDVGCSVSSVCYVLNNRNSLGQEFKAVTPKPKRFAPPRVTDPSLLKLLTTGKV